MALVDSFGEKLDFVLKALSVSRGRLAADIGVDKSIVGRWCSGTVTPSPRNLARLTEVIARRHPGFAMRHWDGSLHAVAAELGLGPLASPEPGAAGADLLPAASLQAARALTGERGATYEGFWRTSRPSVMMPGRVFHDEGMIRRGHGGFLELRMGGGGLLFEGVVLPIEGNLFGILHDSVGKTPVFLMLGGVVLPNAQVLDGLVMVASLTAGREPSSYPIVLERIGDLSGVAATDDDRCADMIAGNPSLAPAGSTPEAMLKHLYRDTGPTAAAAGGHLFLTASLANTLGRGVVGGHVIG